MSMLLAPGNRVLVLGALLAVLLVAYPPWTSEMNGGRYDDHTGAMYDDHVVIEFLGYAPIISPPSSSKVQCDLPGMSCWTDIAWTWLAAEIAIVALLAGAGWFFDRRRGAPAPNVSAMRSRG